MIYGAHIVVFTKDWIADGNFFRDVLEFPYVDAGNDRLFFALPPLEAGFHDADKNGPHELYLVCDDIQAEIQKLAAKGVACSEAQDQGWGILTRIKLPGGGELGLYQPRHPSVLTPPSK